MSSAGFPSIPKSELLARLAEGSSARFAVVTPNQRLAAAVARDFDAQQAGKGLTAWEAADILPLSAFVERLYEDALYSELAAKLPILLSSTQEQALWEDIVRSSEAGRTLLSAASAAALAREAWQLAHAWRLMPRLKGYPANDDARAYADWAWRYEGATQRDRHCDRARLADVVIPHLGHAALKKPAALVAYGFDIVDAQQREFLAALAQAGVTVLACGPEPRAAVVRRVPCTSAKDEIRAAARWARAKLESHHPVIPAKAGIQPAAAMDPRFRGGDENTPGGDENTPEGHEKIRARTVPRIGIVVPDLAQSRRAVQRLFAQAMEPGHVLRGGEARPLPFNISLGEPLSSYPIAAAALLVLDLARTAVVGEIEFARASRLIRSPFLAGAERERAQRARLDAELRKACAAGTSLERLRRAIAKLTAAGGRAPACPELVQRLAELSRAAKELLPGAKRPGEWGKVFSALLDAAGFPGERTPDSAEYQALKKLHEAVAGYAALDRVCARMRAEEACARLARIVADTLFQPEAPQVPVQVLGVLESAGLEFDYLWVMGLTDEAWPMPARPNPFVPVALQRAAGVPEASAAASLNLDRRITLGWRAAAGEVVLSHALREEDRELVASPLIRDLPEAQAEDLALPEYETLRAAVHRARREERIPDSVGPALGAAGPALSAGGTGVFRDQAACPFRAYALHRLGAEGLDAAPAGLDALARGNLVHAMLAQVWLELKSKAQLDAISDADLDALLGRAAEHAILRLRRQRPDAIEGRYAALERSRLVKLGRAWLEIERGRPPFVVSAVEHKRTVSFGGVSVNARLDRMDTLESGGRAVIDYKTGAASVGGWLGPRPDEPQLPLYAVSREPGQEAGPAAVAFACVKVGDLGFKGVASGEGLIPGVKTLEGLRMQAARDYASWEELLAGWRYELEALGREFAAGEARVQPKRGDETCRYCGLQPLCRINERAMSLEDDA